MRARPATARPAPSLHVELDAELPPEVAVGRGTAIFVCGWCFHPEAEIRRLRFVLDGRHQNVMASRMPRLDPFAELHPGLDPYASGSLDADPQSLADPLLLSYRSGFWGLVTIDAAAAAGRRRLRLGLEAELSDGRVVTAPLGEPRIALGGAGSPPDLSVPDGEGPLVAICMATHNPPPDLLQAQLDSIRSQSHRRWVCVISDDRSSPASLAALRQAVGDDPRFAICPAPERLGFYRNFERALSLAPPEAEFVALADQDDRWYPDKLQVLLDSIGAAKLAYSDARIVDRDGQVTSDTYWSARDTNHTDLAALLVANSVSGAAILLRRELLADALPFPPAQFNHYHDHWLGLVALSLGEIAFVSRPLYDYVQHGEAALGHAAANRMPSLRERAHRRDRRSRVRQWRLHYFADGCRLAQLVAILVLRCGDRMTADKRRALASFAAAERSVTGVLRLGYHGALELAGRGRTLGAEWMLFYAYSWRRLVALSARQRPQRRGRLDAVPPPDLAPSVGHPLPGSPSVQAVAAKIAPLELAPAPSEPVRVNVLIPAIDLDHFFGGYIAKFNLALRLARAGARVRIVTVDPSPPLPRSWRKTIEGYSGLADVFEHVEVAFGRAQAPLPVNPGDRFVASTWWTAHIADHACRALGAPGFAYLIQEYEPYTFPLGTYAALAEQSYALPHCALFSSELLRDYFRRHRLGVFAGVSGGEQESRSFQNAITRVTPPSAAELADRRPRRLLFYARPEPHAARNLFELGVLALMQALAQGSLPEAWEVNGVGSLQEGPAMPLSAGTSLQLLPRTGQAQYAALLREHDVGLSLMYTPHPSLVPIEMASAGLVTVTNTFENKTAQALAAISGNLIGASPTVEAIADAIGQAVVAADRCQTRIDQSAVRWSRDWNQSFDEPLLAWLLGALRQDG